MVNDNSGQQSAGAESDPGAIGSPQVGPEDTGHLESIREERAGDYPTTSYLGSRDQAFGEPWPDSPQSPSPQSSASQAPDAHDGPQAVASPTSPAEPASPASPVAPVSPARRSRPPMRAHAAEDDAPSPLNDLEGNFTIDSIHSEIGFVVVHAMVTKVRGRFEQFKGTAKTNKNLEGAAIMLSIKVSSINTRDKDRDAHLTSGDFFELDTFPAIAFSSTDIRLASPLVLRVRGKLTIKDVTRPVLIDFDYNGTAVDPFGNTRVGLEGQTVINRKDFGLSWNAALETGGVLVSDRITLNFDISAIKQADGAGDAS